MNASTSNQFRCNIVNRSCQILRAEILVGSLAGFQVSPMINLGFSNVLRQSVGLHEARHKFSVEQIKRTLKETWRDIAALKRRRRPLSRGEEGQKAALRILDGNIGERERKARILERKLKEMLLFETSVDLTEGGDQIEGFTGQSAARCFDDAVIKGPPDYFAELFSIGRWVSGGILLGIFRDQILRAGSFPNLFPGGIFRYVEHGSKGLKETEQDTTTMNTRPTDSDQTRSKCAHPESTQQGSSISHRQVPVVWNNSHDTQRSRFRALDVFFLSQFDQSCGGLLSPLLRIALEYQSLSPWDFDSILNKSETIDGQPNKGPQLETLSSSNLGVKIQTVQLSGSGAILRFRLDDETGRWSIVLWPLTGILWLLEYSDQIYSSDDDDDASTLYEHLQRVLPYDVKFVRNALRNDSSCEFLRTFDARRLELSAWTRHASAALSSLVLSTIAGCLCRSEDSTMQTDTVDLKIGRRSGAQNMNLNGYRSLKFAYFNKYWIQVFVQPFDGSLRIAFPEGAYIQCCYIHHYICHDIHHYIHHYICHYIYHYIYH